MRNKFRIILITILLGLIYFFAGSTYFTNSTQAGEQPTSTPSSPTSTPGSGPTDTPAPTPTPHWYCNLDNTPPSGWFSKAINISSSYYGVVNGDDLTQIRVCGAGRGMDVKTYDAFQYGYTTTESNFLELTTQIDYWAPYRSNSEAGIMIRDSTSKNAKQVAVTITKSNGVKMSWRTNTAELNYMVDDIGDSYPPVPNVWLKLVKQNNTIYGYYSYTGQADDWILIKRLAYLRFSGESGNYLYGVAVASDRSNRFAAAEFVNFTVDDTPIPTNTPVPTTPTPIPTPIVPSIQDPGKDIGILDGDIFTSQMEFIVGQEATIKLTMHGAEVISYDEARPLDVITVIDRSTSMSWRWNGEYDYDPTNPIKMDVAKDSMHGFVDGGNPASDQIGLVSYSGDYTAEIVSLDHPLNNDFDTLNERIDELNPEGTTAIGAGLTEAVNELSVNARDGVPRYIVLTTDGQQNTLPSVFEDDGYGRSILQSAVDEGITVFTVAIGGDSLGNEDMEGHPWTCPYDNSVVDDGEKYLMCIANYTGGQYFFAPTPEALQDIFGIIKEIILRWNTSFEDYINDTHFEIIEITKVTDINGSLVENTVDFLGNKIFGDFGVVSQDDARIVYIRVNVNAGPMPQGSWITQVNASPTSDNKVIYTDPSSGIVVEEIFFEVNPTIEVRDPYVASISGLVYDDKDYSCSVGVDDVGIDTVDVTLEQLLPADCAYLSTINPNADGTYSFADLGCFEVSPIGETSATYRLTFSTTDPQYIERCGSLFNINLVEDQDYLLDLSVSLIRDPWFQSFNGGIYANGSINAIIPSTASQPYLILSDGTHDDGVAVGTSIFTGDGSISSSNWTAPPTLSAPPTLNFARLKEVLLQYADDTNYSGHRPVPGHANSDGIAIYYAPADITLNGNWQNLDFAAAIIVDGSVIIPDTIVDSKISLGPNGFLLLAARDDIVISSNIGTNTNNSTELHLEGLFVAGRNFDAGGTGDRLVDYRLNIKGLVVVGTNGPGSYLSARMHEENYLYPSDYFIYNPKLIINIPNLLSQPIYSWQEVE